MTKPGRQFDALVARLQRHTQGMRQRLRTELDSLARADQLAERAMVQAQTPVVNVEGEAE